TNPNPLRDKPLPHRGHRSPESAPPHVPSSPQTDPHPHSSNQTAARTAGTRAAPTSSKHSPPYTSPPSPTHTAKPHANTHDVSPPPESQSPSPRNGSKKSPDRTHPTASPVPPPASAAANFGNTAQPPAIH